MELYGFEEQAIQQMPKCTRMQNLLYEHDLHMQDKVWMNSSWDYSEREDRVWELADLDFLKRQWEQENLEWNQFMFLLHADSKQGSCLLIKSFSKNRTWSVGLYSHKY